MQSNDMEKLTHKAFFFFFFFFNKRKLKEKQRENKVGQNEGSFTCSYLFQRKECTINIYSERILKKKKKRQILLQKDTTQQLSEAVYGPCTIHCTTLKCCTLGSVAKSRFNLKSGNIWWFTQKHSGRYLNSCSKKISCGSQRGGKKLDPKGSRPRRWK